MLGSSGYFHGLGSVRAGQRTGNQSDSLLEAEAQEERIESGIDWGVGEAGRERRARGQGRAGPV